MLGRKIQVSFHFLGFILKLAHILCSLVADIFFMELASYTTGFISK